MSKTKNYFEVFIGLAVIAMAMTLSATLAHAESPNILVGSDLTVGSSGQDVVVLQGLLSELGYLSIPAGISQGYYGALTQSALGRYQASLNVSPSAGYFGPVTKVAMHQAFAPRGWLSLLGW